MSYKENINHRKDELLNRGFDYHGHILEHSLSSAFYLDSTRSGILAKMESIFSYLVDSIKHIKKSYNYTHDKDFINFN